MTVYDFILIKGCCVSLCAANVDTVLTCADCFVALRWRLRADLVVFRRGLEALIETLV